MSTYNWPEIKAKLKEAVLALPNFVKNPVQGMRQLPDWDWPTLIILQVAFAVIAATLKNIVDRDVLGFFLDFLIAPIAIVVVIGIGTGFTYYVFKFLFNREDIAFKAIYTHLVFAAVPSQVTNVVSKFLPPINLLGLAATLMLLHVGFVSNFHVDRERLKKCLIAFFSVFAIFWAIQLVKFTYRQDSMKVKATPESLDILERELNLDKNSDD